MEIKRNGSQPSVKGPSEWFTGMVRIDPLFQAPDPARVQGASVTFEPGARTAWHTHPLGQTLIVTSGCGRAQRWGGPVEEIRPGRALRSWCRPRTALQRNAFACPSCTDSRGKEHRPQRPATSLRRQPASRRWLRGVHIASSERDEKKAVTWTQSTWPLLSTSCFGIQTEIAGKLRQTGWYLYVMLKIGPIPQNPPCPGQPGCRG